MALISVHGNYVGVAADIKVYIFGIKDNKFKTLELPHFLEKRAEAQKKTPCPQSREDSDTKNAVLGIQFSPCGKWLCAFSSMKQLILWETEEWSLASERYMPKTACSLAFSQDSKRIVIVDKSGDALLFSIDDLNTDGSVLLGHLSMLLDVIISPEDKFILTCDRDEKIRVSHFPNAYNIAAYCLGHTEFVSSLCLLAHNTSVLVSGSGDGTIRLWEYSKGLCLNSYDCNKESEDILQAKKGNKDNNAVTSITKLRCGFNNSNSSTLCAVFHEVCGCFLYSVNDLSVVFLQTVLVENVIIDAVYGKSGELWIYSSNKKALVHCFNYDKKSGAFSLSNSYDTAVLSMCENLSNFVPNDNEKSLVPHLYKRKFENVKDYYEQKKARSGN